MKSGRSSSFRRFLRHTQQQGLFKPPLIQDYVAEIRLEILHLDERLFISRGVLIGAVNNNVVVTVNERNTSKVQQMVLLSKTRIGQEDCSFFTSKDCSQGDFNKQVVVRCIGMDSVIVIIVIRVTPKPSLFLWRVFECTVKHCLCVVKCVKNHFLGNC